MSGWPRDDMERTFWRTTVGKSESTFMISERSENFDGMILRRLIEVTTRQSAVDQHAQIKRGQDCENPASVYSGRNSPSRPIRCRHNVNACDRRALIVDQNQRAGIAFQPDMKLVNIRSGHDPGNLPNV